MTMPLIMNKERLTKLISSAKFYELNLHDDNIKACLIAVYMYEDFNDEHLDFTLMEAYRSQPTVFIGALRKTREFRCCLEVLNREIE
jgi:hypothetical protein